MTGMTVQINEDILLNGYSEDRMLFMLCVTQIANKYESHLYFEGTKKLGEERHIWFDSLISNDSIIEINFDKKRVNSVPIKVTDTFPGETSQDEIKLKRYYYLKKELEGQSLI